jgi:hypothetical protein
VLKEFDVTPDPKTQAIIGLIIAIGTVYAPRAIMISTRLKAEKKSAAKESATVYNANGTFAGETTFSEVKDTTFSEPVDNTGTI